MEDKKVLILLATYNGENYVRQMIDSVLSQDYKNIQLVLSDDGSKDSTADILDSYAESDSRVTHYRSGKRFGCAQNHFMHLLSQFSDAPYIMFCDQDDIWHSDKVRKTLDKMLNLETDSSTPTLVHTDLRVVDGNLCELSPSFCEHSNLDGTRLSLKDLLLQNVVTGCTVMINNALAKLAGEKDLPDTIMMHDWWLALIAAAFGNVGFLSEATIDYRQHGNNSVGAKDVRSVSYLLARLRSKRMRESLFDAARQAEAFLSCFEDRLNDEQKKVVAAFASTKDKSLLARDIIYLKYGLYKYGFVRIAAQFLGW